MVGETTAPFLRRQRRGSPPPPAALAATGWGSLVIWLQPVGRVGLVCPWSVCSMEGMTTRRNKLFLPSSRRCSNRCWRGQLALVSWRSSDPASVVVAGQLTTSSSMSLTRTKMFGGLKLGSRMAACGGTLLLQPCQMKKAALESGEHGEDPWPTRHKVSVLPPTAYLL